MARVYSHRSNLARFFSTGRPDSAWSASLWSKAAGRSYSGNISTRPRVSLRVAGNSNRPMTLLCVFSSACLGVICGPMVPTNTSSVSIRGMEDLTRVLGDNSHNVSIRTIRSIVKGVGYEWEEDGGTSFARKPGDSHPLEGLSCPRQGTIGEFDGTRLTVEPRVNARCPAQAVIVAGRVECWSARRCQGFEQR